MSVFSYSPFCHFKRLSWGALFWPLFSYLDCVTATSSPIISQTTCFKRTINSLSEHQMNLEVHPIRFLRSSLFVFSGAVSFLVFPFTPSATWPWHVLGCSTDRTSETCKYLKDFSEISPSHTDLCINLKKDECLLDGVAIELQCAPYVLISQNHVLFPLEWWPWDDVKNTILQWNAIKLKSVWM